MEEVLAKLDGLSSQVQVLQLDVALLRLERDAPGRAAVQHFAQAVRYGVVAAAAAWGPSVAKALLGVLGG